MIKINYTFVVSVQFYYLDSFCYSFFFRSFVHSFVSFNSLFTSCGVFVAHNIVIVDTTDTYITY